MIGSKHPKTLSTCDLNPLLSKSDGLKNGCLYLLLSGADSNEDWFRLSSKGLIPGGFCKVDLRVELKEVKF